MLKTNVNIKHGRQILSYGIEYVNNFEDTTAEFIGMVPLQAEEDAFQFFTRGLNNCIRQTNSWYSTSYDYESAPDPNLPASIDLSSINIYFPQHSVETYVNNNWYAVEITTYVNGDRIILGSFLIDRREADAYPGIKMIAGVRYYEYINVKFPDPWRLTYSDEWALFRTNLCQEPYGINNTGSVLNVEIHPVFPIDQDMNEWHKSSEFTGGSSSLLLSDKVSDYLTPVLSLHIEDENTPPTVRVEMKFNEEYDQNDSGLEEYIRETYDIPSSETVDVRLSMILCDKENIYNYYYRSGVQKFYDIDPADASGDAVLAIPFTGWTDTIDDATVDYWKEGLSFNAMFSIYRDNEPFVTVKSASLPLSKEVYSVLAVRESGVPTKIDLDSQAVEALNISINGVDMTDISVVNKIVKQVINVKRPNDYRSNMIRPVFIRVQDNPSAIELHSGVTENIGIDLHKYKNNVKNFVLKVNGVEFSETGRIGANVIFKVIGDRLPADTEDSIYYILDDNKELVTFGDFKIK